MHLGIEKLSLYSLSLEKKTKIVPEFLASISLPSSRECAWADITHHSPEDGSEMLAENSGTSFVFFSRLGEQKDNFSLMNPESNNLFSCI